MEIKKIKTVVKNKGLGGGGGGLVVEKKLLGNDWPEGGGYQFEIDV